LAARDQNSGTDYLFRRPVVEANGKPSREKGCLSPISPQIDDGDAHPSCFSSGRCSIPEHYNYPAGSRLSGRFSRDKLNPRSAPHAP